MGIESPGGPSLHLNALERNDSEFPVAEKRKIDTAVAEIRSSYHEEGQEIDEWTCKAQQEILSHGSQSLPYLAELSEKEKFRWADFSQFLSAMGEHKDIPLALHLLESQARLRGDYYACLKVADFLGRAVLALRQKQEKASLHQVATRLISLVENLASDQQKLFLPVLSITGDLSAHRFFERRFNGAIPDEYEQHFQNNPDTVSLYNRHRFSTWNEIRRQRNIDRVLSDDLNPFSEGEESYTNMVRINRFMGRAGVSEDVEPTAAPAMKLHLFNYLEARCAKQLETEEADLERELQRFHFFLDKEREYSHEQHILPTIGIELELPIYTLTEDRVGILSGLGIPNYRETEDKDRPYVTHEVNPDFSYSPDVQSRIIQELAPLGALPLVSAQDPNERPKIDKNVSLSLHINFGFPVEITREDVSRYGSDIACLNDAFIYGFASPRRLRKRFTHDSLRIKDDAKANKKTQAKQDARGLDDAEDSRGLLRLELRANEFKDFPTYRLLNESQKLTGCLFCYIKGHLTLLSPREMQMSELWEDFKQEMLEIRRRYDLVANQVDRKSVLYPHHMKDEAIDVLEKSNLKQECRLLTAKYARKVTKILKEDVVNDAV